MKIIPSLIAVLLVASVATYFAGCGKKSAENNQKTVAKEDQVSDEIAALRSEKQAEISKLKGELRNAYKEGRAGGMARPPPGAGGTPRTPRSKGGALAAEPEWRFVLCCEADVDGDFYAGDGTDSAPETASVNAAPPVIHR